MKSTRIILNMVGSTLSILHLLPNSHEALPVEGVAPTSYLSVFKDVNQKRVGWDVLIT